MAKQEDTRKDDEKDSSARAPAKTVEVQFTGIGTWTLEYPGKGTEILQPGQIKKFNLSDKLDLHHLLGIVKMINSRANMSSVMDKNDPDGKTMKYRYRWTIINGKENLPPVLLSLKYQLSNIPTEEQKNAILSLAPNYFDKEPAGRSIPA
jgi:hypothetical protein